MNRGDNLTIHKNETEFDSLNPDQHISDFVDFTTAVKRRFQYNNERVSELDVETQDILHFIEMSGTTRGRANVYKRLEKIRQERRQCKNENDMLKPVYEWIEKNTGSINSLNGAKGSCRKVKDVVTKRMYSLRTDVLSDFQ